MTKLRSIGRGPCHTATAAQASAASQSRIGTSETLRHRRLSSLRPVISNPPRASLFVNLGGSDCLHHNHGLWFGDNEVNVVEPEEGDYRQKRDPLIAVNEGVIARESKAICRGNR